MPSYSNNYSKWDALELSDDSDIEGHPNVDHKSLVRWKQRDIHEKREARRQRIAENEATIAVNEGLLPRLETILKDLETGGPKYLSQLVQKLREHPSPDAPAAHGAVKYDTMTEALLNKVYGEVVHEQAVPTSDEDVLGKALVKQFKIHLAKFKELTEEARKVLKEDLEEQHRHITSEDLHVGWDSKYVPPPAAKPEPALKSKPKQTTTTIETLNAPDDSDDDSDDALPSMTPSLKAFAQLPVGGFERSYEFLKNDKGPFVEGAVDALLLEAFHAESNGKRKYAKQCVHQGLMVQYCEKLGKEGIGMFFKKMIAGNQQALKVFEDDVNSTYAMIRKRAAANKEEQEKMKAQGGVEQIQLVAEDPSTVITFDVPDGPPPADLRLAPGPETEGLDVEEVRKALQARWDIFEGFDPKLKKALESNKLDNVNKVLGKMTVEEAERVVELLQIAGILQFAEGGIRDETGKGPQDGVSALA